MLPAALVGAVITMLPAATAIIAGCSAPRAGAGAAQSAPLVGITSWAQWERQPGWQGAFSGSYEPDAQSLRQIARSVVQHNSRFVLIGGTWSSDCRREMPAIHEVMRAAGVGPEHIRIIAVDESMSDPAAAARAFGVATVTTLIILKNGFERGRIAGKPTASWEQDICVILAAP